MRRISPPISYGWKQSRRRTGRRMRRSPSPSLSPRKEEDEEARSVLFSTQREEEKAGAHYLPSGRARGRKGSPPLPLAPLQDGEGRCFSLVFSLMKEDEEEVRSLPVPSGSRRMMRFLLFPFP